MDAVRISDITYLRTDEGWVYLCAVRDACSRRVIGWAMDSAQTSALVERALRMAYILRGAGPADVVFHVDLGTQYTSTQLNDVCNGLGIRRSVGRTGVCWDNAMQESFWSTLKTEFYDRRDGPTRHAAIRATGRWIEKFYKRPDCTQPWATTRPWNTNYCSPRHNNSRHKPPDQLSTTCGQPHVSNL